VDRGQAGPELGDQLFGDLASLVLLGLAGQPRRDPQAPPRIPSLERIEGCRCPARSSRLGDRDLGQLRPPTPGSGLSAPSPAQLVGKPLPASGLGVTLLPVVLVVSTSGSPRFLSGG
jgi:hypothetical protein